MKYLKNFKTYNEYEEYMFNTETNLVYLPNVSHIINYNILKFNPKNTITIILNRLLNIENKLLVICETTMIDQTLSINTRVDNIETVILSICETTIIDPTIPIELRINNIENIINTILI